MWITWVSFFIVFFLIIGVIIWFIVHNKSVKKIDVLPNAPLVLNLCRQKFTEGYSEGILAYNGLRINRNGTYFLKYFPTDISQGKDVPRPDAVSLIVKKENLIPLAVGEGSSRRMRLMIASQDPSDYPDKIRDSILGKFLTAEGLKGFLLNAFGEGLRERNKVVPEILRLWSGGEMTAQALGKLIEENAKTKTAINVLGSEPKKDEPQP